MDALYFIEVFIPPHFKKEAIDANTACPNCVLIYPCLSHLPAFDLGMVAALWPFLSIADHFGEVELVDSQELIHLYTA